MIFNEKKNLDFYRNLGTEGRYAETVGLFQNTDLKVLGPGKYETDGKNVYANVTTCTTIPWEEAKYEVHEHYIGIQYMIEGSEIMDYASVHGMIVKAPYNPDKDVVSSENIIPGLRVMIEAGQYLISSPWDAHESRATDGESVPIKKMIAKIRGD